MINLAEYLRIRKEYKKLSKLWKSVFDIYGNANQILYDREFSEIRPDLISLMKKIQHIIDERMEKKLWKKEDNNDCKNTGENKLSTE